MDISLNISTGKPKIPAKTKSNVDKTDQQPKFVKTKPAKPIDTKPKPKYFNVATFKTRSEWKTKRIDDIEIKPVREELFSPKETTWQDLGVHDYIVQYMEKDGKAKPTFVQGNVIPKVLAGENVMVRSQTGSGKTFAYVIPIVHALASVRPKISRQDGMQVVVVVPTRELALQTFEEFRKMLNSFCWIVPGHVSGGEKRLAEKKRLKKGINILVGTPGRLMDHIKHSENFKLDKVRCLVVDEADSLIEHGYQEDVKTIIKAIQDSRKDVYNPIAMLRARRADDDPGADRQGMPLLSGTSTELQTLFLTVTLSQKVNELRDALMKDFESVSEESPLRETPENVAIPTSMRQRYIVVEPKIKLVTLAAVIAARARRDGCKMFVFMDTRHMVDYHEELFKKTLPDGVGIEIFKIHGSMEQRERIGMFRRFREARRGVLLCTDSVSRGIDVFDSDYVVQYTAPPMTKTYVHRVGRTARAGKVGTSLIFIAPKEVEYVTFLRRKKNIDVTQTNEDFFQSLVPIMNESSPESAALALQNRFEQAVKTDEDLETKAHLAYSSWSSYYRTFRGELREYFNSKLIYQGHYLASFAIAKTPHEVNQRNLDRQPEKKINKKLSLNPDEQPESFKTPGRKRPSTHSLVMSEYDSGLSKKKQKK